MTSPATTTTSDRTQATTTAGIRPRPTLAGLVVTGPQRWPWFDDEDERANHKHR